jgi:uncharacterized membrane protein YoaK (UPF0700 family)
LPAEYVAFLRLLAQYTDTEESVSRLHGYLAASVRIDLLIEIQLLLLTFSTGIQDAISFPDFQCFASNQTGNSVVMAVGLAGAESELINLANVGTSLGLFLLGSLLTGQIANAVGPRRRGWLLLTHLIQTGGIFAAAVIQSVYDVQRSGSSVLWIISFLAFSSGAQVASMRPMRINEITTAMATAAWVDLVIDPKLIAIKNHPRDRRTLFLASLVAGSFAGAFMRSSIGSPNSLIVSAAGKLLVTLTLLFNREEKSSEEL